MINPEKLNGTLMKAIIVTKYGSPEVLQLAEVKKPEPKDDEILVNIQAAGITRADTMMRKGAPRFARLMLGLRKPKNPIPGTGLAGRVERVGKNVTRFKPGDLIFGESGLGFGAYAEYVNVPENGVLAQLSDNLPFEEAATFTDGPLTALNFLKKVGKVKKGDKVLINGASGSIGTAAVQLAKHFGAEVTGVSSAKNHELVRSLGADHVIDYKKQDFTQADQKYDIIFDTVGKSSFPKAKKALKKGGRYLSPELTFPLLIQMLWTSVFKRRDGKKALFSATGLLDPADLNAMLLELKELYEQDLLKVVIDRRYRLEEIVEAHRYVDTGHKAGNVVIGNAEL